MINFLRNLFFHDFWLKLFSLALAILIWIIVSPAIHNQTSPAATLTNTATEEKWTFSDIPVLIMSSAADVRDFKVSPNQVEVTVRGEPGILQKIIASDIRAQVDLTGIEAARDLHKRIEVTTPPGITFVDVVPKEVTVLVPPKR